MSSREFDFESAVKREASQRQAGHCARCAARLSETQDSEAASRAHHVIPNQVGDRANLQDWFLRSADNCVLLCQACHFHAHDCGRWRKGAVMDPTEFPYSHGVGNRERHLAWVRRVESQWQRKQEETVGCLSTAGDANRSRDWERQQERLKDMSEKVKAGPVAGKQSPRRTR